MSFPQQRSPEWSGPSWGGREDERQRRAVERSEQEASSDLLCPQQPLLDDEEQYYTYSTDDEAHPHPTTGRPSTDRTSTPPPPPPAAGPAQECEGGEVDSDTPTTPDAPISSVVTSSEERRRRDVSESRKVWDEEDDEVKEQEVELEAAAAARGGRSRRKGSSSSPTKRRRGRGGGQQSTSTSAAAAHAAGTSGRQRQGSRHRRNRSLEETYDHQQQQQVDPRAAWPAAFREEQQQRQMMRGGGQQYQQQQQQQQQYHQQQAEWPSAFRDERQRLTTHDDAARTGLGLAGQAGLGPPNSVGYGSLVHPLATEEAAERTVSPPLALPAPRLLPRKSTRSDSPPDDAKSPATRSSTATGATVPSSSSYQLSIMHEHDEEEEGEEGWEEGHDEEIGLLPSHLRDHHQGQGAAHRNMVVSPVSEITENTDRTPDTSLSPPEYRGRSGRQQQRDWRAQAQQAPRPPPPFYSQEPDRPPSTGSGGSSNPSHPQAQQPLPLHASGSNLSNVSSGSRKTNASSGRPMTKRALRRHRRKREEAEARERAVQAIRGVPQPPAAAAADRVWGVLFLVQLLAVAVVAITLGPGAMMTSSSGSGRLGEVAVDDPSLFDDDTILSKTVPVADDYVDPFDDPSAADDVPTPAAAAGESGQNNPWSKIHIDYRNAMMLACIVGLYTAALTALTIGFMMILSSSLIQTALAFTILLCFAWGTVGVVLSPYSFVPVLGFVALALSLGYSVVVWDSIPFAATNLNTALSGVRCTADILLMGFGMMVLCFLWCVWWAIAFLGVYDYVSDGGEVKPWLAGSDGLCLGLLVISYFWTYNVINNIIQAVVAGTIGNWWFHPEEVKPFCSTASRQPLARSLSTSFGSICYGSLLVKPMQVLKRIVSLCCCTPPSSGRQQRGKSNRGSNDREKGQEEKASKLSERSTELNLGSPLARMRRYALRGTDTLCKYFNHWAFVYIGIYGYNFWDSGKRATTLFNTRGWTNIVADLDLIRNVLFMASVAISLCTGLFGLIVEEVDGYTFTSFNQPTTTAFVIGSMIGLALSNVMLNIIGSATNAVLVCFAAGNVEFSRNHPHLSNEMKQSWGTVWSGYFV